MPKFSFVLDVRDPPEKVIGAMIDFSDRRPEIWPNLSAKIYHAHSVDENTADVTEGSDVPGGGVWERVTYEWTDAASQAEPRAGLLWRPHDWARGAARETGELRTDYAVRIPCSTAARGSP